MPNSFFLRILQLFHISKQDKWLHRTKIKLSGQFRPGLYQPVPQGRKGIKRPEGHTAWCPTVTLELFTLFQILTPALLLLSCYSWLSYLTSPSVSLLKQLHEKALQIRLL